MQRTKEQGIQNSKRNKCYKVPT